MRVCRLVPARRPASRLLLRRRHRQERWTRRQRGQSLFRAVSSWYRYRDGGSFIDANSNQKLRLDGSSAWAISYDKGLDRSYRLQFYVSCQSTHSNTTPAPLPMTVIYFHLGITYFFDGPIGQGPYFVCGISATRVQRHREAA